MNTAISLNCNVELESKKNWAQYLAFPEISPKDLQELPFFAKSQLIARNRITSTDTYNRTMGELSAQLFSTEQNNESSPWDPNTDKGVYSLQLRRSPFPYLVACGIEDMVEKLLSQPITKAELDFACEYYKNTNVKFFNEKMWRWVVEENGGKLPFKIEAVKDGTVVLPGEPLLTISGPSELIAHFEAEFHRVFYQTLVATRAHALSEILGDPSRFIEVGKRSTIHEEQHLMALKAMYVGSGFYLTSNDNGPAVLSLKDVGTIGHRYVQRFPSEETAFRHAIEKLPAVTLLVDLTDTYRGIDLSLKLKNEYRKEGKKIWLRLDSGDILDQVRYFLTQTNELGMTNPELDKVVVEGVDALDDIINIELMIQREFGEEAKKRVIYGAGGLLVSDQTSRSDGSSGFKLAAYTNLLGMLEESMKFSPGKNSYPGETCLVVDNNGERFVVQKDEEAEFLRSGGRKLFHELTENSSPSSLEEARQRVIDDFAYLEKVLVAKDGAYKEVKAKTSPKTEALIKFLEAKYNLAM